MIAPAEGNLRRPSPDRRMAISRRGSYAKTTPRTSTSPTPITRPRRG